MFFTPKCMSHLWFNCKFGKGSQTKTLLVYLNDVEDLSQLFTLSFKCQTCVCDSGGVWLAHRACLLAPVSRSHTVTSLLPCTADTTQDCSIGCVASRRTRAPGNIKTRQFYKNVCIWTSPAVNSQQQNRRQYLLDERDLWSVAGNGDPSKLTFPHWSPQSANCDKDPQQRTW